MISALDQASANTLNDSELKWSLMGYDCGPKVDMYNEKCPEVEFDNKCVIWAHIAHLLTVHWDRSKTHAV